VISYTFDHATKPPLDHIGRFQTDCPAVKNSRNDSGLDVIDRRRTGTNDASGRM